MTDRPRAMHPTYPTFQALPSTTTCQSKLIYFVSQEVWRMFTWLTTIQHTTFWGLKYVLPWYNSAVCKQCSEAYSVLCSIHKSVYSTPYSPPPMEGIHCWCFECPKLSHSLDITQLKWVCYCEIHDCAQVQAGKAHFGHCCQSDHG